MFRESRRLLLVIALIALGIGSVGPIQAQPKYVIFLIGDGMGPEHVKAAGMYAYGAPGTLSFEMFPFSGELTNYNAGGGIPDSAAAGTSLATGVKVGNGVISMAIPGDGSELETLLEYFKARGKSTGLVSTKFITDATPAAFGAHEPSRQNVAQVAEDYRTQTRPNVILGGGGNGMNIQEFEAAGYTVVTDRDSMQALDTVNIDMVCGIFGGGNLPDEPDLGSLPHLSEMAETALQILDNDPDGFFVMIEGAKIDTASHSNQTANMVLETVEFNNAAQVAIDWAQGRTDTLIIVTADHETGGLVVLENNGAGQVPTVEWTSGGHTETNVPLYAWGMNAEMMSGITDNTELFGVVTAGPNARDPNPADGAVFFNTQGQLSWTPGTNAVTHNVYFGENFNEVNDGTASTFMGNVTEASCTVGSPESAYPQSFVPDKTYYWRVDEVNDLDPNSPWKGDVWSFTTAPGYATQPDPAHDAVGVSPDAFLSWWPGLTAATRDVYFGTSSPPPFIGNQAESSFDPNGLEPKTSYYWRVDEIEADGKTIYPGDIWSFTTARPGTGTILYEVWEGIGGERVLYLTSSPDYPFNPTLSTELSSFDAPVDRSDYFGGRIHGYLVPETSGDYRFWIASDDYGELWLSSDQSPDNAVLISTVNGWTDHLEFDSFVVTPSEPISLVGGQRYYIMALYKEGVGGDNCAVAWQGPDSPERKVIAGYYLSPFVQLKSYSPGPADGATSVQRTRALSWLPGATAATHDVYFSADQQAVIDSTAFMGNQAETSYSPSGLVKGTVYYWRVDEVEADGTTIHTGDVWSFVTAPGYATRPRPADHALSVALDATLRWSPGFTSATHDVYFGTSNPPGFIGNQTAPNFNPGPLELSTTYYWQIDEIEADGTTIYTGDIWSFKTPRPGTGTILLEFWVLGLGTAVSDLTSNVDYPYEPIFVTESGIFEVPTNLADAFGGRIHGFLQPETSGDYTFWIASDYAGELWLSTDSSPANTVLIAHNNQPTNPRQWDVFPEQKSDPISLTGGRQYYIMALYREDWDDDHCAVAWQGPDNPTRSVIDGYYLSPYANLWAWMPEPADGAKDVPRRPTLSWRPGATSVSYDVYLSTDRQAVADGTAAVVNQTETSYSPAALAQGATYYWRVDAVEADGTTKHTGDVWSFTVTTLGR